MKKEEYLDESLTDGNHHREKTHLFNAEFVIALTDSEMQKLSNYQIWYVTDFWRSNPREYWIYEGDKKIPTKECLAYKKFRSERQRRRDLGEYGYEGATKERMEMNRKFFEQRGK
jgi:hypothetical protein